MRRRRISVVDDTPEFTKVNEKNYATLAIGVEKEGYTDDLISRVVDKIESGDPSVGKGVVKVLVGCSIGLSPDLKSSVKVNKRVRKKAITGLMHIDNTGLRPYMTQIRNAAIQEEDLSVKMGMMIVVALNEANPLVAAFFDTNADNLEVWQTAYFYALTGFFVYGEESYGFTGNFAMPSIDDVLKKSTMLKMKSVLTHPLFMQSSLNESVKNHGLKQLIPIMSKVYELANGENQTMLFDTLRMINAWSGTLTTDVQEQLEDSFSSLQMQFRPGMITVMQDTLKLPGVIMSINDWDSTYSMRQYLGSMTRNLYEMKSEREIDTQMVNKVQNMLEECKKAIEYAGQLNRQFTRVLPR